MMENRSMRASLDNESDESRTQRQAVGGATQARSGVERVNLRGKQGASMVDRSSGETPCSEEQNQPSTSQQLQQMQNQCRGQFAGVNI